MVVMSGSQVIAENMVMTELVISRRVSYGHSTYDSGINGDIPALVGRGSGHGDDEH